MAIVLTRDTVGTCCCTASFGVPSLLVIGSCEGSKVNISSKKVSLKWYLSSLLRGDCVGMICRIGSRGAGIEVNISARKVSLTLKEAGGVQNDPLVRRMSVISHMVMLWSQKFLTLSKKISTTRY